jgi:hypothetical protein
MKLAGVISKPSGIRENVILRANSMIFIIRDPVAIEGAIIKFPTVIVNKIIIADRCAFRNRGKLGSLCLIIVFDSS